MNSEPDNKLTLEWIKLPDGAVALRFDPRTWKAFEESATARDTSAEHMIVTAVVETLSARPAKTCRKFLSGLFKRSGRFSFASLRRGHLDGVRGNGQGAR